MVYFSVLEVTPTNPDWVEAYLPTTSKLVAKHGGKYIVRTASHEQIEGTEGDKVGLRVIIEWATKEGAQAFMADPEYAPHLKARTDGSISKHWLIEGKDDFAA